MGSCLTLPNRFGRSALGVFSRSALGVFTVSVPVDLELEFSSTFRIELEIDRIEVFEWDNGSGLGSFIKTIPGSSITRIVFNQGLRLAMLFGLFKLDGSGTPAGPVTGDFIESTATFAVARNDVALNDGINRLKEVNNRWRLRAIGFPAGFQGLPGTTRTQTATGALLSFDTLSTFLQQVRFTGSTGVLRGMGLHYILGFPDGINDQICAWHYPDSENPTIPALGAEFRHFGRIKFESL